MYGYWFGMSLIWWVFWAAIIVAFFAFLTPVPRRRGRASIDPLDVLKRRYAAGEITTAEYDERRARLLDTRTDVAPPVRPTVPVPPPERGTGPEQHVHH